jgi:hypothetical protein
VESRKVRCLYLRCGTGLGLEDGMTLAPHCLDAHNTPDSVCSLIGSRRKMFLA